MWQIKLLRVRFTNIYHLFHHFTNVYKRVIYIYVKSSGNSRSNHQLTESTYTERTIRAKLHCLKLLWYSTPIVDAWKCTNIYYFLWFWMCTQTPLGMLHFLTSRFYTFLRSRREMRKCVLRRWQAADETEASTELRIVEGKATTLSSSAGAAPRRMKRKRKIKKNRKGVTTVQEDPPKWRSAPTTTAATGSDAAFVVETLVRREKEIA